MFLTAVAAPRKSPLHFSYRIVIIGKKFIAQYMNSRERGGAGACWLVAIKKGGGRGGGGGGGNKLIQ